MTYPHTQTLQALAQRSPSGYPIASVAYFGPYNKLATKVTVHSLPDETFKPSATEHWHSLTSDLRNDEGVNEEILNFIEEHGVKTVLMDGRIRPAAAGPGDR